MRSPERNIELRRALFGMAFGKDDGQGYSPLVTISPARAWLSRSSPICSVESSSFPT